MRSISGLGKGKPKEIQSRGDKHKPTKKQDSLSFGEPSQKRESKGKKDGSNRGVCEKKQASSGKSLSSTEGGKKSGKNNVEL